MRLLSSAAVAALAVLVPLTAPAATPSPHPAARPRIDLTKVQPKNLLPKARLHTEFIVETNRLGQVTRVRSGKSCPNATFNAQTYGNALQAFIRTPDGRAVPGTYRLTYDYNPQNHRVRRDVALVRAGGVDPNAKGAAADMIGHAHPHTPPPNIGVTPGPNPAPSVNIQRLPDLDSVTRPETPRPH